MLMYLTSDNHFLLNVWVWPVSCPAITAVPSINLLVWPVQCGLCLCLLFLLWRFSCHHFFR